MRLVKLNKKEDMKYAEVMFLEYANSLPFELDFQNFDKELSELPGKYSEPLGAIVIAFDSIIPIGCIALRKIEDNICEMKRLYIKPEYRRKGLGKQLAHQIINIAIDKGYKAMRLDTLQSMKGAIDLYRALGFNEIEPYIYNPFKDAVYMELKLCKV